MTKQFYVLISSTNLEYSKDDGYTSEELEEAVKFNTPKSALRYLLDEIDEDYQDDFEIYEVRMDVWREKIAKEEVK